MLRVRTSSNIVNSTSTNTISIASPAGIVNGDLIIAWLWTGDTTSETWTELSGKFTLQGTDANVFPAALFTKIANAETGSYTFNFTTNSTSVGVDLWVVYDDNGGAPSFANIAFSHNSGLAEGFYPSSTEANIGGIFIAATAYNAAGGARETTTLPYGSISQLLSGNGGIVDTWVNETTTIVSGTSSTISRTRSGLTAVRNPKGETLPTFDTGIQFSLEMCAVSLSGGTFKDRTFRSQSGNNFNSTGNVQSLTIAKPANVISGDFLIAVIGVINAVSNTIISAPVGWSLANSDSNNFPMAVFTKIANSSELSTYTFTTSANSNQIIGNIYDFYSLTNLTLTLSEISFLSNTVLTNQSAPWNSIIPTNIDDIAVFSVISTTSVLNEDNFGNAPANNYFFAGQQNIVGGLTLATFCFWANSLMTTIPPPIPQYSASSVLAKGVSFNIGVAPIIQTIFTTRTKSGNNFTFGVVVPHT